MNKYKILALSLLFDSLGFVSFFIPGIGEFSDVVWAPLSAYLMTKLYKGKGGKVAAAISFVEEALPFMDVVPTFSIMWLYTYVVNPKKSITKAKKKHSI